MIQDYIKGKSEQEIIDNISHISIRKIEELNNYRLFSVVKKILSNEENLNKLKDNINKLSPYYRFIYGSEYGFDDIVKEIFDNKYDVVDVSGANYNIYGSAMTRAIRNGHINIVKFK